MASGQRHNPPPFEPWPADAPAMAAVDSIRARLDAPVDINTASAADLQRLEGIGPGLAGRITEERRRGGPYLGIGQLVDRVRGIGPATASAFANQAVFSLPDSSMKGREP